MISYKYKITNKQGKVLFFNDHETDPNNVYALQKYPVFQKAIKSFEVDRLGQNNYWDFYSYYGKQTLTFSGKIVASDHTQLERMKQQLIMLFALPIQPSDSNDGYVTIQWTDDDGIVKEIDAKLVSDIQFDRALRARYYLDFIIQLKTKDNFVRSVNSSGKVSGIRGYLATGGIFLPTKVPLKWGASYRNTLTVNIDGIVAIPIIRLVGERQCVIHNPRVLNITTGEEFKLNLNLADETKWIEIDTDKGTVIDQDGNDKSAYIDESSTFLSLVNDVNQLVYLSDEDPYVNDLLPEVKIYDYTTSVNTKIHEPIDNKSNTHTLHGGVALVEDRFKTSKQAYSFDGQASSYLDTGKDLDIDFINKDYTVMGWIRALPNPANNNPWGDPYQTVFVDLQGSVSWVAFGLSIKQHSIVAWYQGWGSEGGNVNVNLWDGQWHHVAYVQPKTPSGAMTATEFYIDGEYVGSMASGRPNVNGNMTQRIGIGTTYDGYNSAYKGDTDLLIIEDRRWTASEIHTEYLKQKAGKDLPRITVDYKEYYAS